MPKYSIEFKIKNYHTGGVETRHVKTVKEDPVEVAQLVQEATALSGGLEFLTVRQVKEKVAKPPKTEVKK